ncbi:MAG: right-handed parallel beta-helix repeat-containing protein [Thiotrichaceae bacterium]|nr:right-handed parallel beta-helix repeat-containing protein [Thiotrichaceae bacterium]
MPNTQTRHHPAVHQVGSKAVLNQVLGVVGSGDTIVINRSGNYGTIRLKNLSAVRIKSNKNTSIQAKLSIEGNANKVIIEGINLWHNQLNDQPLIHIGSQCQNIVIRYCTLSSVNTPLKTLRERFAGRPDQWINGIVINGARCEVLNNTLVNTRSAIQALADDCTITKNSIQYFSHVAIQVAGNNSKINYNYIYSPIHSSTTQQTAIKLISTNGTLNNTQIIKNTIKARHQRVAKKYQSPLLSITALDGYFTQLQILNNTIASNTERTIQINGAFELTLNHNVIISAGSTPQVQAGIYLYLSRVKINADSYYWLDDKKYSVRWQSNRAAYFNVAKEYQQRDLGQNRFNKQATKSNDPYIKTVKKPITPVVLPPTPPATGKGATHKVRNAEQLNHAIRTAKPNDNIVITHHGSYGDIRIINKTRLTISHVSIQLPIQANFVIDGNSSYITLDNMQIWSTNLARRYLIIAGKKCKNIVVSHCILTTHAVIPDRMHLKFRGQPDQWTSGMRMLGTDCLIQGNTLVNLRSGILETGPNNLVKNNLVQFFSEDAIRVSHHGVRVIKNRVYDSVSSIGGHKTAHKDAIQLIPPKDRYNGGTLYNIEISENIIKSHTEPVVVPPEQQGIVQGIFASDGYFVNVRINYNTIMVNSDHGITINGVNEMQCQYNKIISLDRSNQFNAGIKFYLTRTSMRGQQRWLLNKTYSVIIKGNEANVFNLPEQSYQLTDLGSNQFTKMTHALGRGRNPTLDNTPSTETPIPSRPKPSVPKPPVPRPPPLPPTPPPKPVNQGHLFSVHNERDLKIAIQKIKSGDQIIFEQSGSYGQLRLQNKQNITIRARNRNISVNSNIMLDGHCKNVTISNLSIWFSAQDWRPIILISPESEKIVINNCFISSAHTNRHDARQAFAGTPEKWITGIWSRGRDCKITNNHIANTRSGIIINGNGHTLQNNLIQYFIDSGMRLMSDNNNVIHNNIYDAIERRPNARRLATGIQMIPNKGRFEGGLISNIKLTSNIIQQKSSASATTKENQAQLQGISLHDGYLINAEISSNTIVINNKHGIIINGTEFMELHNNRIFDSNPKKGHTPGIYFHLTRTIDLKNNRHQVWHSSLNYSVSYSHNQAAIFNIPKTIYMAKDKGNNHFQKLSHNKTQGINPTIE